MGRHKVDLKMYKKPAMIQPFIDGEPLPFCKEVVNGRDMKTNDETIKFTTIDDEIVCSTVRNCDLTAYVKIACIILREELLKHGDLYRGFISSIESSLKEQKVTALPFQPERDIADKILKRIIGEDEPDERKD